MSLNTFTDSKAEPSTADLNYVCKNLGHKWRQLGEMLGESRGALDALEYDFRCEGTYEMAWQLLLRWRRRSGRDVTVQHLAKCLWEIGETDLAEELPVQ